MASLVSFDAIAMSAFKSGTAKIAQCFTHFFYSNFMPRHRLKINPDSVVPKRSADVLSTQNRPFSAEANPSNRSLTVGHDKVPENMPSDLTIIKTDPKKISSPKTKGARRLFFGLPIAAIIGSFFWAYNMSDEEKSTQDLIVPIVPVSAAPAVEFIDTAKVSMPIPSEQNNLQQALVNPSESSNLQQIVVDPVVPAEQNNLPQTIVISSEQSNLQPTIIEPAAQSNLQPMAVEPVVQNNQPQAIIMPSEQSNLQPIGVEPAEQNNLQPTGGVEPTVPPALAEQNNLQQPVAEPIVQNNQQQATVDPVIEVAKSQENSGWNWTHVALACPVGFGIGLGIYLYMLGTH